MHYQSSQIDQLQAQLCSVTEESDMFQRTTFEANIGRRQALYSYEQEINNQLDEILSLRHALA